MGKSKQKEDYIDLVMSTSPINQRSYYERSISDAYQIGRYLIGFDKPDIETDFCYGYCGMSTDDDLDRAWQAEKAVRTDEEAFLNANMDGFSRQLDCLRELKEYQTRSRECFSGNECGGLAFVNLYRTDTIKDVHFVSHYDIAKNPDLDLLTDDEVAAYTAALTQEISKFEKRLRAYIKRYGLSKIHSWTYLRD